jgi:hypothetical protein
METILQNVVFCLLADSWRKRARRVPPAFLGFFLDVFTFPEFFAGNKVR